MIYVMGQLCPKNELSIFSINNIHKTVKFNFFLLKNNQKITKITLSYFLKMYKPDTA